MKSSVLLFFCLVLSVNHLHSQVSNSVQKKILKVVGEDFVKLEAKSSYPFGTHPETCIVDTSTTLVGDTTGLIFNNEYVLFRDFIHFNTDNELFSLITPRSVTVGDYEEFKHYVRDSLARVKLIMNLEEDEDAIEFLKISKEEKESTKFQERMFTSHRVYSPYDYQLNWKHKLLYDYDWYLPILNHMYLPINERFRGQKEFDERQFVYRYDEFLPTTKSRSDFLNMYEFAKYARRENAEINLQVPILNDLDVWARYAQHSSDEFAILSQLYDKTNPGNPVVGSLGSQANAFCDWKQQQIQKQFNKNKLPFIVDVTLPTPDQIIPYSQTKRHTIPTQNFTETWQITASEYLSFQEYVIDSMSREIYYKAIAEDKIAFKFLKHKDFYLDEGGLEFVEFDPGQRRLNRELFALNFKSKLKKKYLMNEAALVNLQRIASEDKLLVYRYSTIRVIDKATLPSYKIGESGEYSSEIEYSVDSIRWGKHPLMRKTIEHVDLQNQLGFGTGVRLIKRYNDYFQEQSVCLEVAENIDSSDPNALIPSLTYEQALAFYNWKYPIEKFNPKKDNWQQFIYPSKEQFEKIQNGESIVIPEHEVEFPTPLFRYVVHIYPK